MNIEELREQIYNQMNGMYVEECIPEDVKGIVQDEFTDGSACDTAYKMVYEAKQRLNDRLGTDEDKDIEIIIDNMFQICKQLSMKMFDYGSKF